MQSLIRVISKIALSMLALYMVFAFAGSSLILLSDPADGAAYADQIDSDRFLADDQGPDQVLLIDDRVFAGVARIRLIEQAQEKLDVAMHAVNDGVSSDLFYAALLEAADRGVQVRLLFDGMFTNLQMPANAIRMALTDHPNITLGFYEPVSIFKPWNWNNRLHDKFVIVDQTFVMIGGANIEDRHYLENYEGEVVYDREAIICRNWQSRSETSVLDAFDQYFNLLWHSDFSRLAESQLSPRQKIRSENKKTQLLLQLNQTRQASPEHFAEEIDWFDLSIMTNKISLIHNPLMRLNKEPWVLSELSALLQNAEHTVTIQSPYIIPTRRMMNYIDIDDTAAKLTLLTNSPASSPNYFAMAGYLKHKKAILKQTPYLYEYHGSGSLHAKAYIFDQRVSLIGSFNADARSSFLGTESMVVIDSEPFAAQLQSSIDQLSVMCLPADQMLISGNAKIEPRNVPWYKYLIIRLLFVFLYPLDFLL